MNHKLILALVLGATMLFVLFGCQPKENVNPDKKGTTEESTGDKMKEGEKAAGDREKDKFAEGEGK
jgi:hypothetical protein